MCVCVCVIKKNDLLYDLKENEILKLLSKELAIDGREI